MGFDIKKVLGTVAPFLTAALPGPFAGIANKAIGAALGLPPDTKPTDVQAMIDKGTITGDQMMAIKAAEMDFQKTMTLAGYADVEKLEELAQKDRDSARQREVQLKDLTPRILAFTVVAMTIVGEGYLLVHGAPPNVDGVVVGRILGTLDSAMIMVLTYYFGSSAGSAQKTKLLAEAIKPS